MRIAIVTENFLPKVDGVTRTLTRLLEHLNKMEHQVIVFGPESGMSTYANATLYGTTGIPFLPYPQLKLNIWRPSFTNRLIEFKPDIIHLVDPVYFCAALLTILNWKNIKIPIVSSYHTNLATYCTLFIGCGIFENLMWSWNKYCHNQCLLTVCPSNSTRGVLKSKGFNNLRIWQRGVDLQLFSPSKRCSIKRKEWTTDKTIILYVGRISFEKNLELLIQSYKSMDHTQCHLVMVGQGPALNKIKGDTTTIPITFTGYLQGDELSKAYASADLFAFPSFTETFGQVVLESMASGLPVVGLVSEGVKDLVDHGETGLLLDTKDVLREEQITHYRSLLTRLVNDKQERDRMKLNAIEKCKKYTWFSAMEQVVDVYKEAISMHKR